MKRCAVLLALSICLSACTPVSSPTAAPAQEPDTVKGEKTSWSLLTESFYDASKLFGDQGAEGSGGSVVDASRVFSLYEGNLEEVMSQYDPGGMKSECLQKRDDLYGAVLSKGGALYGEGLLEMDVGKAFVVHTQAFTDGNMDGARALYPSASMYAQLEEAGFSQVTTRACAVEFVGFYKGILFYDGDKEAFWPLTPDESARMYPIKRGSLYGMEAFFQAARYCLGQEKAVQPVEPEASEPEEAPSQQESIPEEEEEKEPVQELPEEMRSIWLHSNLDYVSVDASEFFPAEGLFERLAPLEADGAGERLTDISEVTFIAGEDISWRMLLCERGFGLASAQAEEIRYYEADEDTYQSFLEQLRTGYRTAFWREVPIWLAQIPEEAESLSLSVAGKVYHLQSGDAKIQGLLSALKQFRVEQDSVQKVEADKRLQNVRASLSATVAGGKEYQIEFDATKLLVAGGASGYALEYTHQNGAQVLAALMEIIE